MKVGPYGPPNRYYGAPPSQWGTVSDLAGLLGHSPVTSLWVSNACPDTVAAWAAVFRAFPRLERLSVPGYGARYEAGKVAIGNVLLGLHVASLSTADPDPDPDSDLDPDFDGTVACPNLAYVKVCGLVVEIAAVYQEIRTCFRLRRDRGVVLGELELDFDVWNASTKLCKACLKDIRNCTKRLRLHGVSFDESEEDGSVGLERIAEQGYVLEGEYAVLVFIDRGSHTSVESQQGAAAFNAETDGAWASQALEGRRIGFHRPFKSLQRLVEKFHLSK